ncbi:hypothetical protein MA4S0726RA_3143 [Mycobacteroides abscessus 4S-0726-RA]|nr:hypothetical protein MA4S0726RA_3143 [Mycobacteroides abscessus 4S-0726-RA]EIV59386.1 hypothetical protein MA4S0116S_2281 [Mycobacteroides abscessus 4S-0116-S]
MSGTPKGRERIRSARPGFSPELLDNPGAQPPRAARNFPGLGTAENFVEMSTIDSLRSYA